jgi:hypothetical protein
MVTEPKTTQIEKLCADCPTHGTVRVVCPRCAGKAGGRAHRGTRSWKVGLSRVLEACEGLDLPEGLPSRKRHR